MVLGTLPWVYLTLRPRSDQPGAVFVVPFSDLGWLWRGPLDFFMVQLVGNLLVFAALGFFLPIRYALAPASRAAATQAAVVVAAVAAVAALGSLAIEVAQLVAAAGRVFSVDDIMLNAVGAGIAAALSRPWWRTREVSLDTSEPGRAPDLSASTAREPSR